MRLPRSRHRSSFVNIVHLTPGAGRMYCGNCLRDNALVGELRRLGHATLMVPLYLPLTLDEPDQSAGTPIFFGGVNVYLDQKSVLYRKAPEWLRRCLDSPALLRWAGGRAAKTRAENAGSLMLSMLRGEEGNQARDLAELLTWLKSQPERPDVICLSNALLAGFARQLKQQLGAPIVCLLQGEDAFLDALPTGHRERSWQILRERATDIDLFIAPTRYFANLMSGRLGLPPERVRVVVNGIRLEGYPTPSSGPPAIEDGGSPVLGFFARMCSEKGLDRLVEAFIQVKQRGRVPSLKLRIGGGCGPSDEPFVDQLRERLKTAGLENEVQFHPNLDHAQKIEFYRSLHVFSVPALYGEAFGLYVIEAMASAVPVVQPRHAAFPELIEATGGGLICDPTPPALAEGIEQLLLRIPPGLAKWVKRGETRSFANSAFNRWPRAFSLATTRPSWLAETADYGRDGAELPSEGDAVTDSSKCSATAAAIVSTLWRIRGAVSGSGILSPYFLSKATTN